MIYVNEAVRVLDGTHKGLTGRVIDVDPVLQLARVEIDGGGLCWFGCDKLEAGSWVSRFEPKART